MKKAENEIVTVVTKPEFKGDIKAEIKGLPEIEDNIKEVKEFAIGLNNYYKTVVFTEETMKEATDEKANVNKFKDKVAKFRQDIIAEYKKPIELFESTAKETEKILGETYTTINDQVNNYNNAKKDKIRSMSEAFFNEYAKSKNIDFVTYDKGNFNITLSLMTEKGDLTKGAKDEVIAFVDRIVNDLELIEEEELKVDILVEYKKTLNASASILEVKRRAKAIEDEKIRQQQIAEARAKQAEAVAKVEEVVVVSAPVVEEAPKVAEPKYNMSFKIIGETKDRLLAVRQWLDKEGYKYE